MMNFICPVCKNELADSGSFYRCKNGHCYDKSKFGYVNLLQSQKSSAKRHGDDRVMVRARRDFLDKGYYGFLSDALCEICKGIIKDGDCVLDAGCGECYYSYAIKKRLGECQKDICFFGIDISKDALEFASKRKSNIKTAVASVFSLPFEDASIDMLLNIFSPEADAEFLRVLKKDGIMIRVIPLEMHLYDLKAAIYAEPYKNDIPETKIKGFDLIDRVLLKKEIELISSEDIQNLFKMTPYYYKTGKQDQEKIIGLPYLKTQAEFEIRVYKKD